MIAAGHGWIGRVCSSAFCERGLFAKIAERKVL
jgi:hypothetical protein